MKNYASNGVSLYSGVHMEKRIRRCGILLHPTSLPSSFGIGSFGEEAHAFIDLLQKAHLTLWQMLPLGPTGYGDSPYASRSTFAGNELLIDLNRLACEGYLNLEDVLVFPSKATPRVDYGAVREKKMPLLEKAAKTFLSQAGKKEMDDYHTFCKENDWWLDDYALYVALCDEFGDSRWFCAWPEELKMRSPKAMDASRKEHEKEIAVTKTLQYFFHVQYFAMKAYANEHGVKIIGDIPIFVAPDSVDVWTNPQLFQLDAQCNQKASSGVPPDAFSADGQLWGNPLYDWPVHEKEHFAWWTRRIKAMLTFSDIVRIDHFRGFSAYWKVPAGETTAKNGTWVKAPGKELFKHLKAALGDDLPVIAEDLGVITPDVEELRDGNGFPGMKILQFAFGYDKKGGLDADNLYLPHNCDYQSVIYTGTHDNNTTRGWYDDLDDSMKDKVRRYLESSDEDVVWQLMRAALMSTSKDAVFPMQDWLGLDASARMNVPATCGTSNWSWRLPSLNMESWRIDRIRDMVDLYGRHQEEERKA
jgi:4-alpha-glucanotransferase